MNDLVKVLAVERNGVDLDAQEEFLITSTNVHRGLQRAKAIIVGSNVLFVSYADLIDLNVNGLLRSTV